MTVVQAYICAKHYQVTWWSLWLAYWGVLITMGGLLLTEKRLICFSRFEPIFPRSTTWRPTWGCSSLRASPSTPHTPQMCRFDPHQCATKKDFPESFYWTCSYCFDEFDVNVSQVVQGFSSKYGTKLLETVSACWLHKRTIFDWKRLFLTLTFGSR